MNWGPCETSNPLAVNYFIKKLLSGSSRPETVIRNTKIIQILSNLRIELIKLLCHSLFFNKVKNKTLLKKRLWQSNFIVITLRHGWSPVSLLHVFRTPFHRTRLEGCFCYFWLWLTIATIAIHEITI